MSSFEFFLGIAAGALVLSVDWKPMGKEERLMTWGLVVSEALVIARLLAKAKG